MKHRTSTSVSKANTNIILTNTFKSLYSGAKVQYTCTMKCYLTIKKSDIINFEGKWERLEKKPPIMLYNSDSEIQTSHAIFLIRVS